VAGLPLRSPKTNLPMGPRLTPVPHFNQARLAEYRESLERARGGPPN
jgi:hypothetical protein